MQQRSSWEAKVIDIKFFIESQGSLWCSQETPSDPYIEPNEFNTHCHVFKTHFNIILLLNLLHTGSWSFKFQMSCPFPIVLGHYKEYAPKSEALGNIS